MSVAGRRRGRAAWPPHLLHRSLQHCRRRPRLPLRPRPHMVPWQRKSSVCTVVCQYDAESFGVLLIIESLNRLNGPRRGGVGQAGAGQAGVSARGQQVLEHGQEGRVRVVRHVRAAQQRRPAAAAVALVHGGAAPLDQKAHARQLRRPALASALRFGSVRQYSAGTERMVVVRLRTRLAPSTGVLLRAAVQM